LVLGAFVDHDDLDVLVVELLEELEAGSEDHRSVPGTHDDADELLSRVGAGLGAGVRPSDAGDRLLDRDGEAVRPKVATEWFGQLGPDGGPHSIGA